MIPKNNSTSHNAEEYDAHISCTIPYYPSFHKETINIIKAIGNEPQTWLDTGCGTGSLVKMAMDEFPRTRFILIDPSSDMLEQAKMKLRAYTPQRLEFLDPLPSQELSPENCQKVDVITAIQSHHYLSGANRIKAIKSCYERLNDNGVFISFENIRPSSSIGTDIGIKNWESYQLSCGRDPESVQEHLKRFDVEFLPITVAEHLEILKNTGFEVVEILWFSYMQAGFYAIK